MFANDLLHNGIKRINTDNMKMNDIVKLLANKINQPHVIEVYFKKVSKGAYEKGVKDTKEKFNTVGVGDIVSELCDDCNCLKNGKKKMDNYCKGCGCRRV